MENYYLPNRTDSIGIFKQNGFATSFMLGIATFCLGQALQSGNGFMYAPSLVFLTISLVFTLGSFLSIRIKFPPISQKEFFFVFFAALVWQIYQLVTSTPGFIMSNQELFWQFQVLVIIGGASALLSLAPDHWFPIGARYFFIALVFSSLLAEGIWIIRANPDPYIDVFMFHQTSSRALMDGRNPYELTEPNLYEDTRLYGDELVNDGKMTIGNPYPPLSIFLSTIGYYFAGDIRFSHLIAIILTSLMLVFLSSNKNSLLAVYLFMFTPRAFLVLEQSWTEVWVLLFAVFTMWCSKHRPAFKFIAFGLMIASKQYMLLFFPLIILFVQKSSPMRIYLRAILHSLGAAFLVTAPLAFWNFSSFVWNVGLAQFYQPFRPDSLSYTALYTLVTGIHVSQYLSFIVLILVIFSTIVWLGRAPSSVFISISLCLVFFFALSKQAFCNYYFLVIGLLCCTLVIFLEDEITLRIFLKRNITPMLDDN